MSEREDVLRRLSIAIDRVKELDSEIGHAFSFLATNYNYGDSALN